MSSVGQHLLIEYSECDVWALNDETALRSALLVAIGESGARIIDSVFHSFSPHGVTGIVGIAESHVSIHTWPELRYAAVDIFTCSPKMNSAHIVEALRLFLQSRHLSQMLVNRGPNHALTAETPCKVAPHQP
jgi:S-adenosylmethionine decarboxylase proenzyme